MSLAATSRGGGRQLLLRLLGGSWGPRGLSTSEHSPRPPPTTGTPKGPGERPTSASGRPLGHWAVSSPPPAGVLASALATKLKAETGERETATAALLSNLERKDRLLLAYALLSKERDHMGRPLPVDVLLSSFDDSWNQKKIDDLTHILAIEETGTPLHIGCPQQEAGEVEQPSRRALMLLALSHGIPFVGFGFLDNFIMITAGESIEATLGAVFTISSMGAAGMGNLISDIAGLSLQEVIAKHSHRFAKEPDLTAEQEALSVTQSARTAGAVIGISVGCIIGMCPLLVLPG